MALRKKLRRIKRFAYLGGIVGLFVGAKRWREQQTASPAPLGPPAAWPPLRATADVPVAAAGRLATDAERVDAPPAEEPSDRATETDPAPAEEPSDRATETDPAPADPTPTAADASAAGWVRPLPDGSCPLTHPIKANDNSMIYHSPGGRFYQRTHPERCYVDVATAETDGYRAAKGAGGTNTGGAS